MKMYVWWKKCNSDQWWNNDKCRCECKKSHVCEKDYIWSPPICSCKNGKYLASIKYYTFEKVIESCNEKAKTIPTNINEKKATCKIQNFYVLVAFLLITTALLIAVSTYCNLIKYQASIK